MENGEPKSCLDRREANLQALDEKHMYDDAMELSAHQDYLDYMEEKAREDYAAAMSAIEQNEMFYEENDVLYKINHSL